MIPTNISMRKILNENLASFVLTYFKDCFLKDDKGFVTIFQVELLFDAVERYFLISTYESKIDKSLARIKYNECNLNHSVLVI